jgi:hypothetical protein
MDDALVAVESTYTHETDVKEWLRSKPFLSKLPRESIFDAHNVLKTAAAPDAIYKGKPSLAEESATTKSTYLLQSRTPRFIPTSSGIKVSDNPMFLYYKTNIDSGIGPGSYNTENALAYRVSHVLEVNHLLRTHLYSVLQ